MRTSIVSFGLGSATGSALSCFCLAWFSSPLMCFLVSFSDGFQVLVFLAVGHWAPSEKGNGLLIPHTFVWGSYFLFCIPSAVRPPSVRRPLLVLLSLVQHCYTHTQRCRTHTHTQLFHHNVFTRTHTHTPLSHATLSHTRTHTQTHARAFVTQLCPTQLCHTHTHAHTALSHAILSHTHTQLCYTHNSSHTHTHTQLFHTELCHTHTHSKRGTWGTSTSPPCRRHGTW